MLSFELLNVHGTVTRHGRTNNSGRQLISTGRRAASGLTGSSASTTPLRRPVALAGLGLIEDLGNHELSFFLLFVLP
nr:hypothetical protein Itr_chr11CG18150 [Ipomoea trifida]